MSALSDLLNQAIAAKFPDSSNRDLAKRAGVSRGTVDNYRNGVVVKPTEDVLQAFHALLGVPIQDLRLAAGLPRGEAEPYKAPAEANLLDDRQRNALDELIRSIVATRGQQRHDVEATQESGTSGTEDKDQKTELPDEDQVAVGRIRATNKKVRRNTASDEAEGA